MSEIEKLQQVYRQEITNQPTHTTKNEGPGKDASVFESPKDGSKYSTNLNLSDIIKDGFNNDIKEQSNEARKSLKKPEPNKINNPENNDKLKKIVQDLANKLKEKCNKSPMSDFKGEMDKVNNELQGIIKDVEHEATKDFLNKIAGGEVKESPMGKPVNIDELKGLADEVRDKIENSRTDKLKEQIFNDDGSINAEKAGELFESGELTLGDFQKLFGVQLSLSNSGTATLEDGTTVHVNDQRWTGMTDAAVLVIKLPDGQELRFEQRDKKSVFDDVNDKEGQKKEINKMNALFLKKC